MVTLKWTIWIVGGTYIAYLILKFLWCVYILGEDPKEVWDNINETT